MSTQPEPFEALWQNSLTEPAAREVPVKKIEIDLSLDSTLDYFLLTAEKYLQQGKIKKGDYEEVAGQISALKGVLGRINEKKLVADVIADRAKRRVMKIQDEINTLASHLSGRSPR